MLTDRILVSAIVVIAVVVLSFLFLPLPAQLAQAAIQLAQAAIYGAVLIFMALGSRWAFAQLDEAARAMNAARDADNKPLREINDQ